MESSLKYRCIFLLILLSLFSFLIFLPQTVFSEELNIRIAVAKKIDNCVIAIRGGYQIIDLSNGKVLEDARKLDPARVVFRNNGIHIGKRFYQLKRVRIDLQKDVALFVNNVKKRYRGSIDIIGDPKDGLTIINSLDLETYIKGVLYHEVSHKWPLEAMQAQAVATRTYALYQMKKNAKMSFDVTSDIYSQVYGGRSAERYRTNLAVERTNGEVLSFNGEVLPAYFHSNSGGHTEDVSELWEHDLPPLKGVKDEFAQSAPSYQWKKNFKSSDIQNKLNQHGFNLGLIKEIRVVERNKSGRIRNLEILTRDGKSKIISGKKFREIIGPNEIRSNMYDVVMKGYYFDLIGKGWGHGVGMCQWGAYTMSQQRYNYEEILKYYYPGVEIVKVGYDYE